MTQAAAGQRSAFATLVQRHETAVRRFCRSLLEDASQADDAAQDAFVALWEARARYKSTASFKSYIFTIARNRCFSLRRKQRWLAFFSPEVEATLVDDAATPDDAVADDQQRLMLRQALLRVPVKFREPLTLRFLENMSYEDIAVIIGRTPSTARSRIFYGLKALAQELPQEMTPWHL